MPIIVPALGLLVSTLAHLGGPLLAMTPSAPLDDPRPRLSLELTDDLSSAVPGETITYRISVRNGTAADTPIALELTLPAAAVTGLHAERSGTVVANAVAWRDAVRAGETTVYRVDGTLRAQSGVADLSATACVHNLDETLSSCTVDRTAIVQPEAPKTMAVAGALLFGGFAVASAFWLLKRIRPDLLTPANAHTLFGEEPVQPGGAPSA